MLRHFVAQGSIIHTLVEMAQNQTFCPAALCQFQCQIQMRVRRMRLAAKAVTHQHINAAAQVDHIIRDGAEVGCVGYSATVGFKSVARRFPRTMFHLTPFPAKARHNAQAIKRLERNYGWIPILPCKNVAKALPQTPDRFGVSVARYRSAATVSKHP